jgi:hypothetical protein
MRYECADFWQLHCGKRPCAKKDDEEGQQESARHAALTGSWRDVRQDLWVDVRGPGQCCVPAFRHWSQGPAPSINSRMRMREGSRGDKPIYLASRLYSGKLAGVFSISVEAFRA